MEKDLPFEVRKELARARAEVARFAHGLAQLEADRVGVLETLDRLDRKQTELELLHTQADRALTQLLVEHGLK